MKKVVLLGDSIRMNYGQRVAELLASDCEVWQPDDNCRFASYTQRMLFDYRAQIEGADVVHWNNGHWDYCVLDDEGSFTEPQVYVDTMLRIARSLKEHTKHVIFATTTPVAEGNPYNTNRLVRKYNAILVPRLAEMGVEIDDLYTPVAADIDRYIRADDRIHLTDAGIELCAKQVADCIRGALK